MRGDTTTTTIKPEVLDELLAGVSSREEESQAHLQELDGVEVSPDLISRVTDAGLEAVRDWQARPLDPVYPVVFFDALRVKIRDEGLVKTKAIYIALALDAEGQTQRARRSVLGLWIEQSEGAKFWLKAMNDLRTRGVQDSVVEPDMAGAPWDVGLPARRGPWPPPHGVGSGRVALRARALTAEQRCGRGPGATGDETAALILRRDLSIDAAICPTMARGCRVPSRASSPGRLGCERRRGLRAGGAPRCRRS